MRSATSRWNISTSRSNQGGHGAVFSQETSRGVDDAIGQIGDDAGRRGQRERAIVDLPGIGGNDVEPSRIERRDIGQRRQAALVLLDGDHAGGAFEQQRPGEAAGAGAYLDDGDLFERPRRAGDAPGQVEIEQEVLAEAFLGGEPEVADHLAERRQAVGRGHARASVFSCMAAARRSASIRLRGLAWPVPAMPKAVP